MKQINNNKINIKHIFEAALVALLLTVSVSAMSGGSYELTWSTIDGGGGLTSGGQYMLIGTVGQPDVGRMTGGGYELLGGFWPGDFICLVDFYEYAMFAEWWMDSNCGPGNEWCYGADLDEPSDGKVDFDDLLEFSDYWLFYCPSNWQLK